MEIEYVLIFIGVILALLLLYFGFTRLIKNKELKNNFTGGFHKWVK